MKVSVGFHDIETNHIAAIYLEEGRSPTVYSAIIYMVGGQTLHLHPDDGRLVLDTWRKQGGGTVDLRARQQRTR